MEAIKTWFQDWSDACEYANECVPDFSFLVVGEPYTALASIAASCFILWAWNERRINRFRFHEALTPEAAPVDSGELNVMLDEMKRDPAAAKKMAA